MGSGAPDILTSPADFDSVTGSGIIAGGLVNIDQFIIKQAKFAYVNPAVTATFFNGIQLDWAFAVNWANVNGVNGTTPVGYDVSIFIGCNLPNGGPPNICYINFIYGNVFIPFLGDDADGFLRAGINIPNGCE